MIPKVMSLQAKVMRLAAHNKGCKPYESSQSRPPRALHLQPGGCVERFEDSVLGLVFVVWCLVYGLWSLGFGI